jgi:hypothetical protein
LCHTEVFELKKKVPKLAVCLHVDLIVGGLDVQLAAASKLNDQFEELFVELWLCHCAVLWNFVEDLVIKYLVTLKLLLSLRKNIHSSPKICFFAEVELAGELVKQVVSELSAKSVD